MTPPPSGGSRPSSAARRRVARAALALLPAVLVATVLLGASHQRAGALARQPAPAVDVAGLPAELVEATRWAVALFDEAGLELPPLQYRHHPHDSRPCYGGDGAHHDAGAVNVIELCVGEVTWPVRLLVLHETAHAWADHALPESRREAFRLLRGWTHWRAHDQVAWHENGTEQAAEIIVWGLVDRPVAMVRIERNGCDDLELGYRTLTGRAPLHGFRDLCG